MSKKNRTLNARDKRRKIRKCQKKVQNYYRNKREFKRKNKRFNKMESVKNFVEIFTSNELSEHEISILAKGLKFIPSPDKKR